MITETKKEQDRLKVYDFIRDVPLMTAAEISIYAFKGNKDHTKARPRVTELAQDNYIISRGRRNCSIKHNPAAVWEVNFHGN